MILTGCSGYIGQRLIAPLVKLGYEVIGLDRSDALPAEDLDFHRVDLTEPGSYNHLLRADDLVLHLAAAKGDWGISDAEYSRDNTEATRCLLSAGKAVGIRRWVFYSTVAVLGPSGVPLPESAEPSPAIAYGRTKLACEALFREYVDSTEDCSVVVIRPSVVFGAGNPWNTNIYRLIDALSRRRFVMIGDGGTVKTTSYIDNLIAANLFLMERWDTGPRSGLHVYHYVDEPSMSTGEMVTIIRDQLGMGGVRWSLPLWIASPLATVADMAASVVRIDLPITSARIRKFCTPTNFSGQKLRELGFVQPVSNEQALRTTVDWYLAISDECRTGQ